MPAGIDGLAGLSTDAVELELYAQVQSEDQSAMRALIRQGFVVAGSWRLENTRKENKQRLHSLIEVAQRGFRHEVDNRYLFRLLSSEVLRIEEPQNSDGPRSSGREAPARPRLYLLIGDHLYSLQADVNHPLLAGFREFERERAQELALSRQLGQPAFRSAGIVGHSQSLMTMPLGSGLDEIMRQCRESSVPDVMENSSSRDIRFWASSST